jgi:glycosyltransferase involved in cell wall biosynthesis
LRVVHVITRFIRGGADENTLLTCNGQAARGHDVTLVYGAGFHPSMVARLDPRVRGVNLASLVRPIHPLKDVLAFVQLWRLFRRLRPELVHTHESKAGIVGRMAAWAAGVPLIVHGVHILAFLNVGRARRLIYLAAERAMVPITHAFVDVSEGMRAICLEHGIGQARDHFVVASGMDVDGFRKAKPVTGTEFANLLPPALDSWDEAQIVLMAAAFEERKQHIAFLAAFAKVAEACPNVVLVLAGEGPLVEAVRHEAVRLGIADRVAFIGFSTDIARWLKRADVCVLASAREGLPRSIVQYALAACPIVTTRLPGIEQVVAEGETGFIVHAVDEMAQPVIELLNDAGLRVRFSRATAGLDLSAWSSERMIGALEELYAQLAARRRPITSRHTVDGVASQPGEGSGA